VEEHWGLACTAPALDAGRALWPAKLKNDESCSHSQHISFKLAGHPATSPAGAGTPEWQRTGCARQTGQTWVFGGAPYSFGQPQKALLRVLSWMWHSMPMTAS